jgi:hypothetical protein
MRKIKQHSHYHIDLFPRRHNIILPRYQGSGRKRPQEERVLLLQRRYPWGGTTKFGIEWIYRNKPMWEGENPRYQNLQLGKKEMQS